MMALLIILFKFPETKWHLCKDVIRWDRQILNFITDRPFFIDPALQYLVSAVNIDTPPRSGLL